MTVFKSTLPENHPFMENKYTVWYYRIIYQAKNRACNDGYTEKHHIIPDCFYVKNRSQGKRPGWLEGDSNLRDNIVVLTAREHFLCHWLLTKITTGNGYYLMLNALCMLKRKGGQQQRILSSWQYSVIKEAAALATSYFHTGKPKPKTKEHRQKISDSLKRLNEHKPKKIKSKKRDSPEYVFPLKNKPGRPMPAHVKEKMIAANKGLKHSAERREKHSNRMKGHSGLNNKKWKIHDIIDDIEYFPTSLRAFIRTMGLNDALYEAHRNNFLYKGRYKVYQLTQ
jgi:hypothetical protein